MDMGQWTTPAGDPKKGYSLVADETKWVGQYETGLDLIHEERIRHNIVEI